MPCGMNMDPYVKFVGIKLNLPKKLIANCKSEYWKIYDDALIQELEEIVSMEETFHNWSNKYPANVENLKIVKGKCF